MKPRISIICPTRNVGKYIRETIESVRTQTYQGWEFLVMDGNSTDDTRKIVGEYVLDSRIKLFSEPDEGPWDATDKGLELSQGEFICILGGQDGFLDKEWLAKCLKIIDEDSEISLVWGSAKDMREDGTLVERDDVSSSHLMGQQGILDAARYALMKIGSIFRDLLFAPADRKRFILQKIFSPTARLKTNYLLHRGFPGGRPPEKEDWFVYWLNTGFPFNDQGSLVFKRVYLECAPRYPRGSKMVNHMTDFNFNFNSRGYLSWYIPSFAVFGRMHPGASGERVAGELHRESEKYFRKILDLRRRILGGHEEIIFRDRAGKPIVKKKVRI